MTPQEQARAPLAALGSRYPMIRLALYDHRVPGAGSASAALSFRHFPFMAEIYRDAPNTEEIVAKKCTQVGWTEAAMVFMVMSAGYLGKRCAYMLPHSGMARGFVQEKVLPMLDRVPHYREMSRADWREKTAANLMFRHFGSGSWRFLGSRNQADLRSFTADVFIVDEYDDCNQAHMGLVKDRLRDSAFPQLFRMANPTLAGRGIDALFADSDGREWHHKCDHCGEWQAIGWLSHVVEQVDDGRWLPRDTERGRQMVLGRTRTPGPESDIRPVCTRCCRPFNRTSYGQWVAARPQEIRRGYHICQMDVPGRSLWDLYAEYIAALGDPDLMRAFYAGVLGLAYDVSGSRITAGDLQGAIDQSYSLDYAGGQDYAGQIVTCGVDVGSVLNVFVSVLEERKQQEGEEEQDYERDRYIRRSVWVGALRNFDELQDLIKRYHVDCCVIDHAPERTKTEELRDWAHLQTRCRVWLCNFHDPPKATQARWGIVTDDLAGGVRVARTPLLDTAFAHIRNGVRVYPGDTFNVLGFSEQMSSPARVLSAKGDRYVWWSGSGTPQPGAPKKPDHYRLADAYDLLASQLYDMGGGYLEFDL